MAIATVMHATAGLATDIVGARHVILRPARSANQAIRRSNLAEYTQGFTSLPQTPLPRVLGLQVAVDDAVADARSSGRLVRAAASQQLFDRHVVGQLSGPPSVVEELREIDTMVALQRGRTELHGRITRYFANGPIMDWFDSHMQRLTSSLSTADAERAWRLLDGARDIADSSVQVAKHTWARARPYEVSREIHPAVYKPGDGGSHPSGHTANVFAEATVLSALDPSNAATYMRVANDMAHSRVLSGAHFPSDVVAGAYIGTRAALRALDQHADVVAMITAR